MDERIMEKEGQNGKRKGWGIERKMLFLIGIVIFSRLEEIIAKDKMESTSLLKKHLTNLIWFLNVGLEKLCHCNSYVRIKQTKVDGNKHFN
jgi:hypothetical protein